MPDARTYTALHSTVQKVADAALLDPDGIELQFLVSDLGSVEACKVAARSFQTSFASMRSRARRLSMRRLGQENARDTEAQGMYDTLICRRAPLAEGAGWTVSLLQQSAAMSTLRAVSLSTGLPIAIGRGRTRYDILMERMQLFNFTPEEWDELTALHAAQHPDVEPWHTNNGVCWHPRPGQTQEDGMEAQRRLVLAGGSLFSPAQDNSND